MNELSIRRNFQTDFKIELTSLKLKFHSIIIYFNSKKEFKCLRLQKCAILKLFKVFIYLRAFSKKLVMEHGNSNRVNISIGNNVIVSL